MAIVRTKAKRLILVKKAIAQFFLVSDSTWSGPLGYRSESEGHRYFCSVSGRFRLFLADEAHAKLCNVDRLLRYPAPCLYGKRGLYPACEEPTGGYASLSDVAYGCGAFSSARWVYRR